MKCNYLGLFTVLIIGCSILFGSCNNDVKSKPTIQVEETAPIVKDSTALSDRLSDIPLEVIALQKAYPDFAITYQNDSIQFEDGTTLLYDDGKDKTFNELLDDADIQDMFILKYSHDTIPQANYDGGRIRNDVFLQKMYGESKQKVHSNLAKVEWFGQYIFVTRVNNVHLKAKAAADEISKYPELVKYMKNSSTWNWRQVRGAKRMSAHSYGIAIDINTKYTNYWQWTNHTNDESAPLKYENRIPKKIVEIFEKHGFIWGGRWYHYDTMHFEYRPELLIYNDLL